MDGDMHYLWTLFAERRYSMKGRRWGWINVWRGRGNLLFFPRFYEPSIWRSVSHMTPGNGHLWCGYVYFQWRYFLYSYTWKKSDLLFLNLRSFLSMWLSTFYLQVFFFQFISMNIKKMCGKKIIVVNTDVCSKKLQLML